VSLRGAKLQARYLLLALLLPAAPFAAAAPESGVSEVRIDSPSIAAIRRSLSDRFNELGELLDSGVVGLTRDGTVALRDADNLPRDKRQLIERLVAEENKDRGTLIREIARANGRPDWEDGLRTVFARRWIQRAPAGWFVQESSGAWARKPPANTPADSRP